MIKNAEIQSAAVICPTNLFVNGRIAYEGGLEHDYAADFGLLGLIGGAFGGVLGGAAAESAGPALFDLAAIKLSWSGVTGIS